MAVTSERQRPVRSLGSRRGNTLLLLASARDKELKGEKLLPFPASFKMKILPVVIHLALLMLYIIPLPSNQVPHNNHLHQQYQQTTRQQQQQRQLRSSAANHPPPFDQAEQVQITPLPLLSPAASVLPNGAQQHPDAPKLIPLSALDRYQEGTDLRLFCSASAPQSGGRLQFEWRKNQNEPLAPTASANPGGGDLNNNNHHHHLQHQMLDRNQQLPVGAKGQRHLSISMMDDSSSVLRINNLEAEDSGNYTCLARNQHGFDSSTVRVDITVRLKWIKEPPGEVQVRAGKTIQLECDASGQPAPLISWMSLRDHQTIHSKVLRIDRAQVNDSGLYECKATSGSHNAPGLVEPLHHAINSNNNNKGEQLRKVVKLIVNGK